MSVIVSRHRLRYIGGRAAHYPLRVFLITFEKVSHLQLYFGVVFEKMHYQ